MPGWAVWLVIGIAIWFTLGLLLVLVAARFFRLAAAKPDEPSVWRAPEVPLVPPAAVALDRRRILLVDDDPGLRILLSTTLAADECAIEEAGSAEEAREVARFWRPSLVVLDVGLPGISGLDFCGELTQNPVYGAPHVILLPGGDVTQADADPACA